MPACFLACLLGVLVMEFLWCAGFMCWLLFFSSLVSSCALAASLARTPLMFCSQGCTPSAFRTSRWALEVSRYREDPQSHSRRPPQKNKGQIIIGGPPQHAPTKRETLRKKQHTPSHLHRFLGLPCAHPRKGLKFKCSDSNCCPLNTLNETELGYKGPNSQNGVVE